MRIIWLVLFMTLQIRGVALDLSNENAQRFAFIPFTLIRL